MELRNFAAWLNQKSIDIQRFGRKSLDIYSLAEDLVKEKKKTVMHGGKQMCIFVAQYRVYHVTFQSSLSQSKTERQRNAHHTDTKAPKYSRTMPQYRSGSVLICPT